MTTTDASTEILQAEVTRRTSMGWILVSRDDNGAQMRKPKSFSFGWALAWFLMLGIGLLVYLFYYMAKKDELVYIQAINGELTITKS